MVLDEIDKIGEGISKSGVEGTLLALLDPEQNSQFSDDYHEATFDLSQVFFIVTTNSIEGISYASHLLEGATSKEVPSVGITIYATIASLLL